MKLISNFKFYCILLILFLLSGRVASSQDVPDFDKHTLKDSAVALLTKYQFLHNKLNNRVASSTERDFVHLFANPRVQVVNDIEKTEQPSKISIEGYIFKLIELFPDGVELKLDLADIKVDRPRYDRNNRYIVRITVMRTMKGISGSRALAVSGKVFLYIAFYYQENSPTDFVIYGSDLPIKGESMASVWISPSYTGFTNSTIHADERLIPGREFAYSAGVTYRHYYSDHFGFGAGVQFSKYSGLIGLDKIDALGGFDPNIREVQIENDLWFVEVPVFMTIRTKPGKRFALFGDLGVVAGCRGFESMNSMAVNANTGLSMINVISDTDWIGMMNRLNFGIQANISANVRMNRRWSLLIGGGFRQGLSGLDHHFRSDYTNTKYQGQYNPLWGAPGLTNSQSFYLNIGTTFLLNKE